MTLREAWEVLERDPDAIMQLLSGLPDIKSRVEAAQGILAKARKIAKNLMAKNHPDVNPDDPTASDKFKQIQQAISTIEIHTIRFQKRTKELASKKLAKDNVVIVIGKS